MYGASNRTRTYDTAVNSRMLYRLSYGGMYWWTMLESNQLPRVYLSTAFRNANCPYIYLKLVGMVGVEPTMFHTSRIYSPLQSPLCTHPHIGRSTRFRTLTNSFGDCHATITSCPCLINLHI